MKLQTGKDFEEKFSRFNFCRLKRVNPKFCFKWLQVSGCNLRVWFYFAFLERKMFLPKKFLLVAFWTCRVLFSLVSIKQDHRSVKRKRSTMELRTNTWLKNSLDIFSVVKEMIVLVLFGWLCNMSVNEIKFKRKKTE